jgi:hypothetical protein
MSIVDIFLDTRPRLGHIALDCSITETHAHGVKKTPYPVEHGSDNIDHIELLPSPITLEGIISDIPPPMHFEPIGPNELVEERSKSAYEQLVELMEKREPFTVVTSLRRAERYFFADGESLVVTRDHEHSESLRFTARLEPYRVAFTSFAEAIVELSVEDVLGEPVTSGVESTSTAGDNLAQLGFEEAV